MLPKLKNLKINTINFKNHLMSKQLIYSESIGYDEAKIVCQYLLNKCKEEKEEKENVKFAYLECDNNNLSAYEALMNEAMICIEASTLGEANVIDICLRIFIDGYEGMLINYLEMYCDGFYKHGNIDECVDAYSEGVDIDDLYDFIYNYITEGCEIKLKNGVYYAGPHELLREQKIIYDLDETIKLFI